MTWNSDIATNAQNWADAQQGTMAHSSNSARSNIGGYNSIGENLYWTSGSYENTGARAVKMWYDEIELTNGGLVSSFDSETGHYTQVVWEDSIALGCGAYGGLIVCQYGPSGNYMGQFDSKVKAPTVAADQCGRSDSTPSGGTDSYPMCYDSGATPTLTDADCRRATTDYSTPGHSTQVYAYTYTSGGNPTWKACCGSTDLTTCEVFDMLANQIAASPATCARCIGDGCPEYDASMDSGASASVFAVLFSACMVLIFAL